jgi:hypothetical protein
MRWRWVLARLPGPAAGVLAAGVLVGCSSTPPADPVQARCQQQSYDDPTVKAMLYDRPGYSGDPVYQQQIAELRRVAVNRCLTAAGVAPPGGVEPVYRAHYGLGWF